VYQLNGGEISFCQQEPSSVFTSELSAIFMALVKITDHHLGEFIILSDSSESIADSKNLFQDTLIGIGN
jgi:hypothetical protein